MRLMRGFLRWLLQWDSLLRMVGDDLLTQHHKLNKIEAKLAQAERDILALMEKQLRMEAQYPLEEEEPLPNDGEFPDMEAVAASKKARRLELAEDMRKRGEL